MTRRHAALPFLAVMLGIAAFSAMDAAMKSASIAAGVYTAVFVRNVMATLMTLPLWLLAKPSLPTPAMWRSYLQRALVVAAMAPLFFYGLVRLPMAEALTLSFIAPLIALYFAAWMLGEAIRPGAVTASLLGLAGVALIAAARLSADDAAPSSVTGIAAILVSAVLYAVNLVLQRRQAQIASPIDVAFFQTMLLAVILAFPAPLLFAPPAPAALFDIALAALLATIALLLLTWGYARAETQKLLPIEYTAFLWAALFGWLFFAEPVGWATIAGAVLIVASCLLAARQPAANLPH